MSLSEGFLSLRDATCAEDNTLILWRDALNMSAKHLCKRGSFHTCEAYGPYRIVKLAWDLYHYPKCPSTLCLKVSTQKHYYDS